jgi:transposase
LVNGCRSQFSDIARFPSAKQLASYVGLTPRIRASAGRIRAGHISKEGNRLLRWVLVLAATQAVRRPGPLRTWFHAVKKRRGKKVARVALARRLAEFSCSTWPATAVTPTSRKSVEISGAT